MRLAFVAAGLAILVGGVVAFLASTSHDGEDEGVDVGTAVLATDEAEDTLRDYLVALADGDYRAASMVLVGGDEPLEERDDLAVLELDELSVDALADALAVHCQRGCVEPTSVVVEGQDGDRGYRATAGFGEPRGHPLERPFAVGVTSDGDLYVRGLPPPDTSPIPPSS